MPSISLAALVAPLLPLLAMAVTLCLPVQAAGQPDKWYISMNQSNEPDAATKQRFKALEEALAKRFGQALSPQITHIRLSVADPELFVAARTIAIVPALKFALIREELEANGKDSPLPVLVVEREDPHSRCNYPSGASCSNCKAVSRYYSTNFLRNKTRDSPQGFNDLSKLFLVHKDSASGYVLPLDRLWRTGIIDAPTKSAADARFTVAEVNTPQAVCNEIAANSGSFGAVWNPDLPLCNKAAAEVFMLHDRILQDLVIVSPDLKHLEQDIVEFFIGAQNDPHLALKFAQAPFEIAGFVAFSPKNDPPARRQHDMALDYLAQLHYRSHHEPRSWLRALSWASLGAAAAALLGSVVFLLLRRTTNPRLAEAVERFGFAPLENLTALRYFLVGAFDSAEFRIFAHPFDGGKFLDDIPTEGVSRIQLIHDAVTALNRKHLIDESFFNALVAARSHHRNAIEGLAKMWGYSLPPPPPPGTSAV